jgi:hypothetical protein
MVNTSMKLDHSTTEANLYDIVADIVDDSLIEKVWCDLDRQVPRDRVSCVVFEVALGFQNATVKTFLPIIVHRRALERLRQEMNEPISTDGRSPDE